MKTVDVRGLSCPEPVIRTQDALKMLAANEALEVFVETVTSRENVSRMARAKGFAVQVEAVSDGFKLTLRK
jgi:TusA-related sulfurtransferase